MNHRVVARLLGRILIIETIALALPLTVCLIYGEAGSAKAFLITMACTAAVGSRPSTNNFTLWRASWSRRSPGS